MIIRNIRFPKFAKEVYIFSYYFIALLFAPLCFINKNVDSLLLLSIVQCFLFAVYLFRESETISFSFLFWIMSHFFSLSILLIPKENEFGNLLPFTAHELNERYIYLTVLYTYFCHMLFSIGCVFINYFYKPKIDNYNRLNCDMTQISKVLFFLGIIPKIFLILKYVSLFLTSSYYSVVKYAPNGIFYFISTLADVGLLLHICCDIKPSKKKSCIILFIIFQFIYAIVGKRGGAIANIVSLVVVICANKKIDLSKLLKICFGACVILFFVVLISQYRGLSSDSRENFLSNFFSGSNIISYMMYFAFSEFGSAFLSAYYSIFYLSNLHSWGKNFLISSLTIMPTTSSITYLVNKTSMYKNLFPIKTNLGGSYIGEAFYSFSWAGVFLFFFYGLLIAFISKMIISEMKSRTKYIMFFFVPMISYLSWWIRDYFSAMVRPFVWQIMLILLVACFIKYTVKRGRRI